MLVDDASVFLDLTRKMLERTGVSIITARNGVDAIRLIQTENPDVVLLDLVMPEMTGDRVCSAVKADPATADIPVIMVTSRGRQEEVERCRRAGCDDFLTKPVKEDALIGKITDLLKVSHRHAMRLLVRIELRDAKEAFFGTSRDISKTGMQLDASKELPRDEEVTLRFFLKGEQNELVLKGKVVRKEMSGARFRYGIQFSSLSLTEKRALIGFLESRTSQS